MSRQLLQAVSVTLGVFLAMSISSGPLRAEDHAPAQEAAHGSAAQGQPASSPNILELKPSLALATLIVFLVLLLVLWRYAWGPLSKALQDREHNIESTLEEAARGRRESERLLAEHRAQMAQAADQTRAILDEGRRTAEAIANDIVQKAQAEALASRERAEREIGNAKDQALLEIWSKTADLAVSIAGKVLTKELSADDQRRLADAAINELPTANGHGSPRA
jgi:F-type H+-transporting ATPase subunit b